MNGRRNEKSQLKRKFKLETLRKHNTVQAKMFWVSKIQKMRKLRPKLTRHYHPGKMI